MKEIINDFYNEFDQQYYKYSSNYRQFKNLYINNQK